MSSASVAVMASGGANHHHHGGQSSATITIDSWLKDLRMECYRRNLETYPNFQSLLFVKDADLKKLGIQNARDRNTMINSLTSFTPSRSYEGFGSKSIKDQNKKATPMKNRLKGFLAGGNVLNKKGKKSSEVRITSPKISFEETKDDYRANELSQSVPGNRRSMSLEDLIKSIEYPQHCTVENDYVPDPQSSPQFTHVPLQRSNTISEPQGGKDRFSPPTTATVRPSTVNFDEYPAPQNRYHLTVIPDHSIDSECDHLLPKEQARNENYSFEETANGSKHLSVVSMESGLGLTCEPDDNFNTSLELEEQPWFHGKMSRSGAEHLLDDDGDFLVHENPTTEGAYTLSLLWDGRCYHRLINCAVMMIKGGVTVGYKYQFENGAFDSIPELIFNHLRYQIPISRDFEAIIRHPVCKAGSKGLNHSSYTAEQSSKNRTLPKNFSFTTQNRIISPDPAYLGMANERSNTLVRNTIRSASFSPADSPRGSPIRDLGKPLTKTANSSSTSNLQQLCLLGEIPDEDEASDMVMRSMYHDVPDSPVPSRMPLTSSTPLRGETNEPHGETIRPHVGGNPYDTYDVPVPSVNAMKLRANTRHFQSSSTLSDSSDYQQPRPYDPDDYEEMRSVSVLDTLPSSPNMSPNISPRTQHKVLKNIPSVDDEQYAFLTPRNTVTPPTGPQPVVNYADLSFKRSNTVGSEYQSAVLNTVRGKQQSRVKYVTAEAIRKEVDAIGGHYAQPPLQQPQLDRSYSTSTYRRKPNNLPRQSSMDLLRLSRPASILSRNTKCPQTIQEIPSFLKEFSNEELAIHLTKADGVCFLLTPRPAEDPELWKNRVQELSTDGVFIGLETLASSTGEKLWKKLFHRHLSLSQLVIVCIVQVTEPVERAKMLKKWIELSQLLQSGTYGNLFAFMSILKGLESPQVSDLTKTWELLRIHYSDAYDIYENQLKGMVSALMQGASVYAIEDLTVPAIQHLRKLYSSEASSPSIGIHSVLEDFTTRVTGLDGLHSIMKHTADLAANARKRLSSYSFDTLLFDFFMQDVTRMHLQTMGNSSEDPLERYRRFNIVLDSLFHKLENP